MFQYLSTEINKLVNVELKKILKNIGWLFFDKVFRMGIGLLVGVWVARYMGPTEYGTFNYLLAFVGVFSPLATLGMDGLVVKELVDHPQGATRILSTVFTMRFLAALICMVICFAFFLYTKHEEIHLFYIGVILSFVLVAQSFNSIDLYYQAKVASRYTVVAQSIAYIIASGIKVALILSGGGLLGFSIVTVLEVALAGAFMLYSLKRYNKETLRLQIDRDLAKRLLFKSWPLIFSGLMIMIYMRIDQIMIGQMIGDYQVGTYSAALKLSEIWYFLPGIIATSMFASIIEAKKKGSDAYLGKLQKLFDYLVVLSLAIALFFTFASDYVVNLLYGEQYKDAGAILAIHIWTSVFVFLGSASSNYFVIENLQLKSFLRTGAGAVVNVILNFILIPKYFAMGAAVATLIAQFCSSYFFDLFSRHTVVLFKMKTKALLGINLMQQAFGTRKTP